MARDHYVEVALRMSDAGLPKMSARFSAMVSGLTSSENLCSDLREIGGMIAFLERTERRKPRNGGGPNDGGTPVAVKEAA